GCLVVERRGVLSDRTAGLLLLYVISPGIVKLDAHPDGLVIPILRGIDLPLHDGQFVAEIGVVKGAVAVLVCLTPEENIGSIPAFLVATISVICCDVLYDANFDVIGVLSKP